MPSFLHYARNIQYLQFCSSAILLKISRLGGGVKYTKCPGYDTEQSKDEVPEMLELWGMWSPPSLPSLPGLLWPVVVAPNSVLSMGQ